MKAMIYFLVSICFIKIIVGECYTENPADEKTCKEKERDGYRCCYVEYRTDRDENYTKLCVEVIKDDIKSGHHEATIISIEEGNYTGSNWNETIMEKFRNYSSINIFDCKANFLFKSLFIFSLLFIIL